MSSAVCKFSKTAKRRPGAGGGGVNQKESRFRFNSHAAIKQLNLASIQSGTLSYNNQLFYRCLKTTYRFKQFDLLINSFLSDQVGIAPHFLTPALSAGLQQHVLQLQQDEMMTAAGIGNDEKKDSLQKMRSDKIYWLDKNPRQYI
ncbi:MAG: hypothetical protein IPL50_09745 [Chitinophagaceae bacterium]|nr:hypothetical protein [Chitinophagaceae bacterium]